jgi:1-acyl-sn-glycerol-3-phosphate acyltransferase
MLSFLPGFLRTPLAVLTFVTNTLVHCAVLFVFALLKLLLPVPVLQRFFARALNLIGESWVGVNNFATRVFAQIEWDIQGTENLRYAGNYLVVSNHQSWVDIPVMHRALNRKIPFLKFFLKQQLIFVPVLGLAWWALDFPFMKRYSKEFLEKHPELKGKDLETTRRSCEKFRVAPVSVMNFVEGTRFTEQKHAEQRSPFKHLLRPKAGGAAFVLNAMGDIIHSVIDITIVYPGGRPTIMDLLAGRVRRVGIYVRELPVPADLSGGDYQNDPAYRERFQRWITTLWSEKDACIDAHLPSSSRNAASIST